MLIITLCAGILICYGIPTAGTFFLAHRKKGIWKAFFSGALAFIVSQLLIRIPILQLLVPRYAWYGALQLYPWLYGLFLGLTAGLAEETARLAAIRLFLKEQTGKEYGLAFGLGHGGIEAMLLVGPVFFSGLALTLTGREALFPATPAAILTSSASLPWLFTLEHPSWSCTASGRKKLCASWRQPSCCTHCWMPPS